MKYALLILTIAISGFMFIHSVSAVFCGVLIERFDYKDKIIEGRQNEASVVAKNTGDAAEIININIYIGTHLASSISSVVASGNIMAHTYSYIPDRPHDLVVNVETNCGAGQTIPAKISVVESPHKSREEPIIIEKEPKPAEILVHPTNLDIVLGEGEVIGISIMTESPEEFDLSVSGIPENWVSFEKTIKASGKNTVLVFVYPKSTGSYGIKLSLSSDKGTRFESDINLFVASQSQETSGEGIIFKMENMVGNTAKVIATNPSYLSTLTISFFAFVLSLGILGLRQDHYK